MSEDRPPHDKCPYGPLARLRAATQARVLLGRSGAGQPTGVAQRFALDHARAREAVEASLDVEALRSLLSGHYPDLVAVASEAGDRATYLRRPDLGRRLAAPSIEALAEKAGAFDVAIVVCDGLSATAVALNAAPVLDALLPRVAGRGLRLAPLVVALQARVALGDQVALALGATAVVVLVGERPGLSASDSLGAYVTWRPTGDTADSARNCISNIRDRGLAPTEAAAQIDQLLARMRHAGLSGVKLPSASTLNVVQDGARLQP